MPERSAGNPIARGSACPVCKHDLQLTEYHVPVLASGMPVLEDSLRGQIQHSTQRIVIGKGRLVLRDLPELPVQALNDVRRVYDSTDLQWIFKESAQDLPVFLPAFHTGGILLPPALCEAAEIVLSFFQRDGGIDLLQIGHELFDVLIADITSGAADLMDDTPL